MAANVQVSTPHLRELCLVLEDEDHEISSDVREARAWVQELARAEGNIEVDLTHVNSFFYRDDASWRSG